MSVTMEYFKSHPLRVAKSIGDATVCEFRAVEKKAGYLSKYNPAASAYIHYGGVELVDEIVTRGIQPSMMQEMAYQWNMCCGAVVRRLMYYLFHITAREMRHGTTHQWAKAFPQGLDTEGFNPQAMELVQKINVGGSYGEILEASDVPLGDYLTALEHHYRKGGWGSAYGGPAWADITLVLRQYVQGEMSAMMAADRAWTLVHNNGTIFNKPAHFQQVSAGLQQVLNKQATSSVFELSLGSVGSDDVQTGWSNFFTFATDISLRVFFHHKKGRPLRRIGQNRNEFRISTG